jgi:hypothetical protein
MWDVNRRWFLLPDLFQGKTLEFVEDLKGRSETYLGLG